METLVIKKTRCQSCKTTSVTQQRAVCRPNSLIIVSRSWVRSSILTATVYQYDWRCTPAILTLTTNHYPIIITRHLRGLCVSFQMNRRAIRWQATKWWLKKATQDKGTNPWSLAASSLNHHQVFQKAVPTLIICHSSNRISRANSSM